MKRRGEVPAATVGDAATRRRRGTDASSGRVQRRQGEDAPAAVAGKPWFLYVIECRDGSLYTGVTVDVATRYEQHVRGKGARYTRSHPPRRLLLVTEQVDRSAALKAEHAMKKLSPARKRALAGKPAPASGPLLPGTLPRAKPQGRGARGDRRRAAD